MNVHVAKAGQNITIIKNGKTNDIGIRDTVVKDIQLVPVKNSVGGSKHAVFIYFSVSEIHFHNLPPKHLYILNIIS
jgi:hypothetical protein